MENMRTRDSQYQMGADELVKNAPQFICPSPRVWNFDEMGNGNWASVVRATDTRAQASYQATKDGRVMGAANVKTELIKVKMKDLWHIDEDDQKVSSNPG
jgi:hypothetical protein